jgi:hypothetical protein
MSITWLARIAVIASMIIGLGATRTWATGDTDVIVASGTLHGQFLADALFHIGEEFWMRVPSDTEFNRWLSQGLNRKAVILLTTDAARYGDVKNVRILSGTLIHNIAPTPTPVTTDRVGRLPEGDMSLVHVLFLKDELTGSFGAVTFETADRVTATKFEPYDGAHINIVIQIDPAAVSSSRR